MTRLTLFTVVVVSMISTVGCNLTGARNMCYRGASCSDCSTASMTYPGSASYGGYEAGPMMPLPGPAASTIPSLPATPPPTN
jgi:hypothetical protein